MVTRRRFFGILGVSAAALVAVPLVKFLPVAHAASVADQINECIRQALQSSLFETNDELLRSRQRYLITQYMDKLKAQRGIYDYRVVCDESNNTPDDVDRGNLNIDVLAKSNSQPGFQHYHGDVHGTTIVYT